MLIRETLTLEQTISLLNGNVVGMFPYMVLSNDSFYSKLYDLCLGYYTARSGEKTISITYERFKTLIAENPTINKTAEQLIGELIRNKFIEKWERVYSVLISEQYNALNNRDYTETKTANNQDKSTYNTTKGKIGNNSDTITFDNVNSKTATNSDVTTFDTNVEDDGKTGSHETTTRNTSTDDDVYGFNSTSPVGDSASTEELSQTIIGDANKNTTHNIQKKTGTESKEFGIDESISKTGTDTREINIDETETHTGTDTKDYTINENIIRRGRDGSGAELVELELNLRNSQIFFDIIYSDIDSIATLQIYI